MSNVVPVLEITLIEVNVKIFSLQIFFPKIQTDSLSLNQPRIQINLSRSIGFFETIINLENHLRLNKKMILIIPLRFTIIQNLIK